MYFKKYGPAYKIITPRLVLRCWDPRFAVQLKEAVDESLDSLKAFLPWAVHEPQNLRQKVDLLRKMRGEFDLGRDFVYGILDPREQTVIGGTGLHTRMGSSALEIGYWIRSSAQGRGYAVEAAGALIQAGLELSEIDRIEIHCDTRNQASRRVIEKLGLTHEATLKRRLEDSGGNLHDIMIWSIYRDEYVNSRFSVPKLHMYDAAGNLIPPAGG